MASSMPKRSRLFKLLAASLLGSGWSGSASADIVITGSLGASDPTWTRPSDRAVGGTYQDSSNNSMPYKVHTIRTTTVGSTLSVTTDSSTPFDSFLALYSSFVPGNPQANLLAADDDGAGYPHARLTRTGLAANTNYYLVITSYSNNADAVHPLYGNYSLTVGGNFVETRPPVFGNVPDQTGQVGVPFGPLNLANHVTLTDGDPINAFAITSGTLPPGLTLDSGTGAISGIPVAAGAFDITVAASDIDGTSNADAVHFAIAKGLQTIAFNGPTRVPLHRSTTIYASAPGGLVTYSASPPAMCSGSGNAGSAMVTGNAVGTCTLTLQQAGLTNYEPITRTVTIPVVNRPTSIVPVLNLLLQ